jgi:hypothetical protein
MTASVNRITATWRFAPTPDISIAMTFTDDGRIISDFQDGDHLDHKEGVFSLVSTDGDTFIVDGTMDGNTSRATITLFDNDSRARFEGLAPEPFELIRE